MAYGSEMLNAVNDIKTALGGTDDGGIEYGSELLNTVVDIKTLVENGGGGGGGLPPVSGTDNGKVLTVVDGAWAAASGGGGGGGSAFIVSVTEESGGELWVMDKTYNEIKTAFLAGLQVLVQSPSNQYETDMYGIVSEIKRTLGEEPQYYIHCLKDAQHMSYASASADGYPVYAW